MTILLASVALACRTESALSPLELLPVVTLVDASAGVTALVNVTVSNVGKGSFSYGGCALLIARQVGDSWAPTEEYRERACAASASGLPAGASLTFVVPRPTEIGLYRIAFVLRHSASERDFTIVSAPFGIGLAPADVVRPSFAVVPQAIR